MKRSVWAVVVLLSGIVSAQTVPSVTVLSVDKTTPNPGAVVTLTAKVTVSGAAAIGGTVTFTDGILPLGDRQVIASGPSAGSAILRTNSFSARTHTLKAVYSGAPTSSQKSVGSASNTIALTPTGTALSSTSLQVGPNGSGVDLTATVTGLGKPAPTGSVRFANKNTGQVYDRAPASSTSGGPSFLPPSPSFFRKISEAISLSSLPGTWITTAAPT